MNGKTSAPRKFTKSGNNAYKNNKFWEGKHDILSKRRAERDEQQQREAKKS